MNKKDIVRLDKFLGNAGITSRKNSKQLLKQFEVTVNGKRVTLSGTRINPVSDKVRIDGELIIPASLLVIMLNKPPGYVSTTAYDENKPNVMSLVDIPQRIYPVGRLDKETRGLLLFTNDGELTHKLIHPKYHVPKVYEVIVEGKVSEEQLKALRTGVLLEDGITRPAEVYVIKETDVQSLLKLTLHEGRNRQIRRMCKTVGITLLDLKRIAFGPLSLEKLEEGEYRELSIKEINKLKKSVGS